MKLETMTQPSQDEAFILVVKVHRGHQLTPYESSLLLNYFDKRPTRPAKEPWAYVVKAVNVKAGRADLRYVHVYDGVAYGADGSRIHWAPTDKQDGYYTVKGELYAPEQPLMDIRKVIDKTIGITDTARLRGLPLERVISDRMGNPTTAALGDVFVNLHYLRDACNGEAQVRFYASPAHNCAYVTCALGNAKVMSI